MRFFLLPSLLSISILCFTTTTLAADWPQWLGPNRDGKSTETGWLQEWPKTGLETLWSIEVGAGYSAPVLVEGRLYTMGNVDEHDVVYCFDAETGAEIWKSSYPCELYNEMDKGGPGSTTTVFEGQVFTFSRIGELRCFDAVDGKHLWSHTLHRTLDTKKPLFAFTASPIVSGPNIVADAGAAVAVNRLSGRIAWKTEDYVATCSSPQRLVLEDRELVAVYNKVGLVLLGSASGEEFSRIDWPTPQFDTNSGTPVVDGNRVFITSGYDRGCGLVDFDDPRSPKIVWEDEEVRTHYNTPILHDGFLYGFNDKTMTCWEFETGEVRWTKDWVGKGCQTLVDGKLLVLSDKGELALVDPSPEGYREIGRTHNIGGLCWTIPVPSGGRIYLRNAQGKVVCLDGR